MDTRRNNAIDFWKFAFSLLIVLTHFCFVPSHAHGNIIWFRSGSIGVEFFFIVSGFLMAKHTRIEGESTGKATWQFIKAKFLGIFPMYFLAYVISLSEKVAFGDSFIKLFGGSVYELLFLQSVGLSRLFGARSYVVQASWYISAMLLAMYILYPIMHHRRELFLKCIAPLLCIFIMGYFGVQEQKLNFADGYLSIMRAAAEICFGCISYEICETLKQRKCTNAAKIIFTFIEFSGYISVFATAWLLDRGPYDFIAVLILGISIMISFSGQSFSGAIFKGDFSFLGKLSLSIYLNHMTVINIILELNMRLDLITELFLVLTMTLALSFACVFLTDTVKTIVASKKSKINNAI